MKQVNKEYPGCKVYKVIHVQAVHHQHLPNVVLCFVILLHDVFTIVFNLFLLFSL